MRYFSKCANAATRLGMRCTSPSGGIGMSKASSPAVFISISSFMRSHTGSRARMSIDSVLASAPSPRGCSEPFTHTSNGWFLPFAVCDDEDHETAERMLHHCDVQPALPRGELGPSRPAQRSERGLGRGFQHDAPILVEHEVLRLLASFFSGVTDSTEPSTLFGR